MEEEKAAKAEEPAPMEEEKAGSSAEVTEVAEEMEAVKVSGNSKVSERDSREHLNLVFIGHVDAGKSTFCGQILYRTGQVDARTIEKYEKEAKEKNRESWFLAFIMDTNEEERAKGKTVEVGRAHFESVQKRYTILDAPGHKNYVPNMIAGACQADVGVLVISARKGEFETGFERGGQTREHALLAKTLGVRILIVVINKMDDQTVEYSEERYNECVEKLTPFLKGCGYNVKKDVIFIPISALAATNVLEKSPNLPWYDGPTFIQALDTLPALERNKDDALRLPILSKYKDMGTVVEGKVEQGTIKPGDKLFVMPNRVPVEVLNVWLDQDEVSYLVGGENARVKLKDISDEDIQPGYVLSPRAALTCPTVRRFEVQLAIVELLEHKSIFSAGYTAILHVHAIAEECSILQLTSQVDKKTGKKSKKAPMFVKSGAVITCLIETEQVVCIEPFDVCPQLGRFTLRDEGKTIGIGKILDLSPDKERLAEAAQGQADA
jgi:peptide chain release factor subunit 3